jgi:hypothetical protein
MNESKSTTILGTRHPGHYVEVIDSRQSTTTAPVGGPYLVIEGRIDATATNTCVHLDTGKVYELPVEWEVLPLGPGVRRVLKGRRYGDWLVPSQWHPAIGFVG